MSWTAGALETDLSTGRKRLVVYVTCDSTDDCWSWDAVGLTAVSEVDGQINPEKVQKVLVNRGWSWTQVVEGAKDFCPTCTRAREQVAS